VYLFFIAIKNEKIQFILSKLRCWRFEKST